MKKELQLLGLTESEAMVYEALVDLGPCKAGSLISRLDIHRNLVYRALETLAADGHITKVTRNGVWWFQIADPQSFLISATRREAVFAELAQKIHERQARANSQIVVYEGVASYRNYWVQSLDRLPDGTINYIFGGDIVAWAAIMGSAQDEYIRKFARKNMEWKSLYFAPPDMEEATLIRVSTVRHEYRVWDDPATGFFGNFSVVGDTVLLHTAAEKLPKVVEIREPAFVRTFQGVFNLMWAKARPFEV